jgi:hypothetical protein
MVLTSALNDIKPALNVPNIGLTSRPALRGSR